MDLKYMLMLCGGSVATVELGGILRSIRNPNPYGTEQQDYFGRGLGCSTSYILVGADWEDEAGQGQSGKAYIFDSTTGVLLHTLDNPNAYDVAANDYFGAGAAICESYAIVGATGEDDAVIIDNGKAYIFDTSTGNLLWTLDNPNPYTGTGPDKFGHSVSICESYAIVGARYEDEASGLQSGKAYIYNPATGALLWTLDNPNPASTPTNDWFGLSVSITESYAIVSAPGEDVGGGGSGSAYIFNPATGGLLQTLDDPNAYGTPVGDSFGKAVAISETYCIVGANYETDHPTDLYSGKAYVFNNATGSLVHTLDNPNIFGTTASDEFGRSVAISNSFIAVGALYEDDALSSNSGVVYIFDVSTGSLLHSVVNPTDPRSVYADNFGYLVGVTDLYAIGSAPNVFDGTNYSGMVYCIKLAE